MKNGEGRLQRCKQYRAIVVSVQYSATKSFYFDEYRLPDSICFTVVGGRNSSYGIENGSSGYMLAR